MIPGRHDIEVYAGSQFSIPVVRLFDLSPYGGPAALDEPGVSVAANIYPKADPSSPVEMDVEVLDAAARTIRLVLPAARAGWQGAAYWELDVAKGATTLTPLAGRATLLGKP